MERIVLRTHGYGGLVSLLCKLPDEYASTLRYIGTYHNHMLFDAVEYGNRYGVGWQRAKGFGVQYQHVKCLGQYYGKGVGSFGNAEVLYQLAVIQQHRHYISIGDAIVPDAPPQ